MCKKQIVVFKENTQNLKEELDAKSLMIETLKVHEIKHN